MNRHKQYHLFNLFPWKSTVSCLQTNQIQNNIDHTHSRPHFHRLTTLFTLIALVFSSIVQANDRPSLIFGYIEFPPYYYTDEKGKAQGHLIDLANDIAVEAGYGIVYVPLPAKRALLSVATGEIDLWFGLSTIDVYKDHVLISVNPIDRLELRVYSSKAMKTFHDKHDLIGKSVVILRGYSYGGLLDFIEDPANKIYTMRVTSHEQALKVLATRNIDYMIDYARIVESARKKYPFPHLKSRVLSTLDVHINLSKKTKNAEQVLKRLDEAYNKIPHDELRPKFIASKNQKNKQ